MIWARMAVATAVFLVASAAFADGCWTRKADFPFTATRQPLSVSTAGRGYVGNPSDGSRAFWRYDPAADAWRARAALPGELPLGAPAFAWHGKPYALVGSDLYRYEPATNLWTHLAGTPTADMLAAFVVVAGPGVYFGGGAYNKEMFWRYDLNDGSWNRMGDLPADLADCIDCSGFALGRFLYVTGTNTGFWRYDRFTGGWRRRAYVDAVYGRAFKLGNVGYVLNTHGLVYAYDPTADSWRLVTRQPGGSVCRPAVMTLGDGAYIALGGAFTNNTCTLGLSNVVWKWSPSETCSR